jgi:hypothetical protein
MLITPPDLAWGLLVLEGCGPLFLGVWRHPLRRCLLIRRFTVVILLHYLALVRTGLPVPLCGRSWPWLGARPAAALRQLYYFFTQDRLEPEHLSPVGEWGGDPLPAPGRIRLAVRPGAHVSSLVSSSSGGQDRHGRPVQRGRITPIMTEGRRGQAVPRRGRCATRSSCSSRPSHPMMVAAVRPPGRGEHRLGHLSRITRRRRRNCRRVVC